MSKTPNRTSLHQEAIRKHLRQIVAALRIPTLDKRQMAELTALAALIAVTVGLILGMPPVERDATAVTAPTAQGPVVEVSPKLLVDFSRAALITGYEPPREEPKAIPAAIKAKPVEPPAPAPAPAPEPEPAPEPPAPAPAPAPAAAAATAPSGLSSPLSAMSLTSPFGYRTSPITGEGGELHTGQDFAAGCGTPTMSAGSGTVVEAGWHAYGGGNRVTIKHGGGLETSYNHLSSISVSTGQTVTAGQQIGAVGTTGSSTGCHLHFEVYLNGTVVDPMGWLG